MSSSGSKHVRVTSSGQKVPVANEMLQRHGELSQALGTRFKRSGEHGGLAAIPACEGRDGDSPWGEKDTLRKKYH